MGVTIKIRYGRGDGYADLEFAYASAIFDHEERNGNG